MTRSGESAARAIATGPPEEIPTTITLSTCNLSNKAMINSAVPYTDLLVLVSGVSPYPGRDGVIKLNCSASKPFL